MDFLWLLTFIIHTLYSIQTFLQVCLFWKKHMVERWPCKIHTDKQKQAWLCSHGSTLTVSRPLTGVHVFGLCATALVTDVIQLATGYHAPFFLTVCKPNYTLPGVACDKNPYITQDICSGRDQYAILSARWIHINNTMLSHKWLGKFIWLLHFGRLPDLHIVFAHNCYKKTLQMKFTCTIRPPSVPYPMRGLNRMKNRYSLFISSFQFLSHCTDKDYKWICPQILVRRHMEAMEQKWHCVLLTEVWYIPPASLPWLIYISSPHAKTLGCALRLFMWCVTEVAVIFPLFSVSVLSGKLSPPNTPLCLGLQLSTSL